MLKKKERVQSKVSLTTRQKKTLKKHSKHHSKKHMSSMKTAMNEGSDFTDAHKQAMKKVGV